MRKYRTNKIPKLSPPPGRETPYIPSRDSGTGVAAKRESPVYTTTAKDEELALILKPEWLPGQRMQIKNYQEGITFLATQLKHHIKKNDLD